MFLADRELERVANDFTRPDDPGTVGITSQRLAAYRTLFQTLQLESGIEGSGTEENVWFYMSTSGLGISGSAKGYAYLQSPPASVVPNLDSAPVKYGTPIYRHLEGGWYLYYERS